MHLPDGCLSPPVWIAGGLLASHDLDMVLQVCERCLVLDRGRLVADGPAAGILGDAGLMERHGLEVPLRLELERRR